MKHHLFFLLFFLLYQEVTGQNYNRQPVCQPDTLVMRIVPCVTGPKAPDVVTYKALSCNQITRAGFRIELGVARYAYNTSTAAWLGNHFGPSFGFILPLRDWNIGFRFKPWTVKPNHALAFGADTLTSAAKLNPVKLDFFVGYSINFKSNISAEPYLGYSITQFNAINEVDLKQQFNIPSARGLIAGLTLNKYFRINERQFFAVFGSLGHSFADYSKTHPSLGKGYSEWTLGIAYKAFFQRSYHQQID